MNQNAEDVQAYLGKLMAELHVSKEADLKNYAEPFDTSNNYKKILRFGDANLKETLAGYLKFIKERNEEVRRSSIYNNAVNKMEKALTEAEFSDIARAFDLIPEYKNSKELAAECCRKAEECHRKVEEARKDAIINKTKNFLKLGMDRTVDIAFYLEEIGRLKTISGYKDADDVIAVCQEKIKEINRKEEARRLEEEKRRQEAERQKRIAKEERKVLMKKFAIIAPSVVCVIIAFVILLNTVIIPNIKYSKAKALAEKGNYTEAISAFMEISEYKDSKEQICVLMEKVTTRETISAGLNYTVGVKSNGTVLAVGNKYNGQCDVSDWTDIVDVSVGTFHTLGLKSDGTVVAVGKNNNGQCDVFDWTNIKVPARK